MDDSDEGVSFTKRDGPPADRPPADQPAPTADPTSDAPFDPYRFGQPEHPIPAEYAPPGYTGPTVPTAPATPYPSATDNPFANPPGTPYGGPPAYGAPPYGPPSGAPYGAPPPYGYPYGTGGPGAPGGPPPPPFHAYPPPRTGNGKAIAALVFGILSIVLFLLSVLDAALVIPGLVFSLIALSETKDGQRSGRGLAIAGLVCTIIGGLLAALMTVAYVRVANKCDGLQDQRSEFQSCVRHNLF